MNKKLSDGLAIIMPNKKINLFVIFMLILGIISGCIFLMTIKDADKDIIINQINNFIKNCLLKSENGNTNVYRVTNIIAGILYKLFESDGLLYFSAKDNKNFNLLINEKSINKLEVKYVFNCKKEKNIIFGQFIEIQDNQIIPRDISDESKNEILKKIGCSLSKVDFDNQ